MRLSSDIDQFEQALAAPLVRTSAPGATAGGERVTGLENCWWSQIRCRHCGHTFRRGDRVRVDADTRDVRHLDPALGCGAAPGTPAGVPDDVRAFTDALVATWPSPPGYTVVRLAAGHPLLAPPLRELGRKSCLRCGHTFREGETVIVCPCRRADACRAAVHRDPALGLACWEAMAPRGSLPHCPIFLTPARA